VVHATLQVSWKEGKRAAMFRDKIESVDIWMSYRQLPYDVRRAVTSYYSEIWVPHAGDTRRTSCIL
jgi:hypothetical protein